MRTRIEDESSGIRVDIVALPRREKVAIEIEMGLGHVVENGATGAAGTVQQLFVVAYNLARHPFTGQTQSQVALSLRSPDGTVTELSDSSIIGRFFDPQAGATQFLLNTTLPAGISSGFYNLNVAVIDQISGVTVDSEVELWVSS